MTAIPPPTSIDDLAARLRAFAAERDWDQFHTPKNLAMAMAVEASEVLEHFQWLSESASADLSPDKHAAVEAELADVFLYLVRLADRLGVDLVAAAGRKIVENAAKYPVALAKGSAKKYTEF